MATALARTIHPLAGCLLAAFMAATFPALSQEQMPEPVLKWFAALGAVDRPAFVELISEDAVIALKDLGVEQTRDEFIAALDEWERTTRDAVILSRLVEIGEGEAVVEVCYRFSQNEQFNVETFFHSADQITGSVQESRGPVCEGF